MRSPRLERIVVTAIRVVLVGLRETRTLGAMAVLRDGDGRVLLVRTPYRVDWGLPGGFLKRGEKPADAIRRELHEELGLDLTGWTDRPLTIFQQHRRHVDFLFERTLDGATAVAVRPTSREIRAVRWAAPDALPPLQPEAAVALEALAVGR